jgi:hypothetical protein
VSKAPEGPAPEEFLSGRAGYVGPRRGAALRLADAALDRWLRWRQVPRRLDSLARASPSRRVLVMSAYRPESERIGPVLRELRASRHELRVALGSTGEARSELAEETVATDLGGGKFANLNAILAAAGPGDEDWTLVVDDDVVLPHLFLEPFIALAEHVGLTLAQPAQTLASHAAWPVTRRSPRALVRQTRFVEIGPVTAFAREAAAELLPFPDLRFGWGLDLHWAAVARQRGWRMGVVDAVPVRHDLGGVASAYGHEEAVEEARRFLAGRDFLPAAQAGEVLAVHREVT